jgi:hypothetical protein
MMEGMGKETEVRAPIRVIQSMMTLMSDEPQAPLSGMIAYLQLDDKLDLARFFLATTIWCRVTPSFNSVSVQIQRSQFQSTFLLLTYL